MHEEQLTEEILKFYDDNYGGLEGFVVSGRRRGLGPAAIRAAAVVVYRNHHNGKPYKNIRVLGQHLLLQAHKIQKKGVRSEQQRIKDLERRIAKLEGKRARSFKRWFINLFEGQIWL